MLASKILTQMKYMSHSMCATCYRRYHFDWYFDHISWEYITLAWACSCIISSLGKLCNVTSHGVLTWIYTTHIPQKTYFIGSMEHIHSRINPHCMTFYSSISSNLIWTCRKQYHSLSFLWKWFNRIHNKLPF